MAKTLERCNEVDKVSNECSMKALKDELKVIMITNECLKESLDEISK